MELNVTKITNPEINKIKISKSKMIIAKINEAKIIILKIIKVSTYKKFSSENRTIFSFS